MVPTASDTPEAGEVTRTEILDWCLTNQFELVQCDDEEEYEEGDEFDEREGKVRIVSALKAHTWSNLRLEEEVGPRPIPSISAQNTEDDINFESLKSLGLEVSNINFALCTNKKYRLCTKVQICWHNHTNRMIDYFQYAWLSSSQKLAPMGVRAGLSLSSSEAGPIMSTLRPASVTISSPSS